MKLKIRRKDRVMVISGRDKGRVGEVLRVIAGDAFSSARVLVSKINIVTRHQRATQTDVGGLVKKEAPLPISKVMLVDPKTSKPTRTRTKTLPDGSKVRVAVKSGETIAAA
ncbi:MAG: 50S ribosomal protein L24 [Elusimicrobia bacterium]|nr:50S ribosomal protein L24 [Elusimicrobiota bacterium]